MGEVYSSIWIKPKTCSPQKLVPFKNIEKFISILNVPLWRFSIWKQNCDTAAGWETKQVLSITEKCSCSPHQPAFKYPLQLAPAAKWLAHLAMWRQWETSSIKLWHQVQQPPLKCLNPLNPELNPICYLLALLAHHFLHVSRIRVKSLTITLLMSYIYGAPILDVSRSHTTTQHSR